MLKQLIAVACLTLLLLSSCEKDVQTQPAALNNGTEAADAQAAADGTPVADNTNPWYVSYASSYNDSYPVFSDGSFIKNGVAKAPPIGQSFEFSNISYDIPSQYNISGDSVTFEAKVKNTSTNGGFYGYDVVLQLFGEEHNAEAFFVGDGAGVRYAHYFVGDLRHDGIPKLVHYFDHFQTVRLVMKNNFTAVYLDSVQLYKFQYGAENNLGRLKKINVAFKGAGVCNQVNLRNSFGRNMILKEDFNIDGQSNTVYYH